MMDGQIALSRGNALLDAAGLDELPGETVCLRVGQMLHVTGDLVWFPTTSVIRSEVGAAKVLGGWIDASGAVGVVEALQGADPEILWTVEVTGLAFVVERIFVSALLERSPRFSQAVMAWLSQMASDTRKRAAYNVHVHAEDAVSRLICDLHRAHGYPKEFNMKQSEIARLTGIQRTTVCAVMVKLKQKNIIRHTRNRITVLQTERPLVTEVAASKSGNIAMQMAH